MKQEQWDELKRWATDRLDYEDNEIGKEHSAYGGHYFAGVLELLAERGAAQAKLEEIAMLSDHQIPSYAFGDNEAACDLAVRMGSIRNLATFDKESKND